MEGYVDSMKDMLERAGWTFAQSFLAVFVIRCTSHLLDVEDANHAKWHEDDLGVLIVLPYAHAVAFAVESMDGEFDNSPIHSFVFSTITQLIVNAVGTIDDLDDFD